MAVKPLQNIWVRRQQCPCGDWKCYIKYDGDDQSAKASQSVKSEIPSLSQDTVFTPYIGQIFKNDDDAFEYYSSFARRNGFSIRKARSTESQSLGVYRRDFVCYRSGFNQPRKRANVEHPRERKSVRCGCDAKLYLTKEIAADVIQWYVSQFSNVHNHELLEDDQVRLLPAYRKIDEADQERILLLSKAGFPVNRIVKVLELEKGVQPGQLPFLEKDVRNFVRSCKKTVQDNDSMLAMMRENDLLELLEARKLASENDEGFVYTFTTDDSGKVENIVWTYGFSIQAFSLFGDVVNIDTSYRSISYNMILSMWFGIDNHGQPVLFGCTLLQDETSKSFSWALQAIVRFMRGRRPQIVVTDMDSGLRDALVIEMPKTKQIICMWHVLSKISSWFSLQLGIQYTDFKSKFDTLCNLENVGDFEHQWNDLVTQFGIDTDKHISLLFSYQASWPFCYVRNFFLARVTTVEFFKSVEAFSNNIMSTQSSLQCFFKQVGDAAHFLSGKMGELLYLPTKTCLPLEEDARTVLTPFAFRALQNEFVLSMQYAVTERSSGLYLVRHYRKMEREQHVIWTPDDEQIHCSCKEFEHSGFH
ncbi:putative protein FAR1-RELATED SEQUENCE 10 isoform X2 [Andrographis paniculata]|uniref:putative protein FAR1-RELATED SEQUENCE 10 isoform X2 n=1 Tax=Andrographis paniculata TaxID=175694 RepID=UPI0021E729A1|nr:putative protein FAR1-RELATED SEQUENCE 10 isoform X2 [Andrographis paniculata]